MGDLAARILAKWRRRGKGTWRVTLIIDGEDEIYVRIYPGDLSEGMLRRVAREELAKTEGAKLKHVHVTELSLEDLP